jgi:hypothetical protein
MKKRIIALLMGVLTIALIAGGCGGSSSDNEEEGTVTTGSLTKAEFVKKGNEICKNGNEEIEAGFQKFVKAHHITEKSPPSEEQSKEAAETILLPAIQKDISDIRALGLPKEDGKGAEEVLHAAEEALEKGEEDPVALIESEGEPASFKKANKLSREYGLTVCGEEEG